jgi:hypothetical protein
MKAFLIRSVTAFICYRIGLSFIHSELWLNLLIWFCWILALWNLIWPLIKPFFFIAYVMRIKDDEPESSRIGLIIGIGIFYVLGGIAFFKWYNETSFSLSREVTYILWITFAIICLIANFTRWVASQSALEYYKNKYGID